MRASWSRSSKVTPCRSLESLWHLAAYIRMSGSWARRRVSPARRPRTDVPTTSFGGRRGGAAAMSRRISASAARPAWKVRMSSCSFSPAMSAWVRCTDVAAVSNRRSSRSLGAASSSPSRKACVWREGRREERLVVGVVVGRGVRVRGGRGRRTRATTRSRVGSSSVNSASTVTGALTSTGAAGDATTIGAAQGGSTSVTTPSLNQTGLVRYPSTITRSVSTWHRAHTGRGRVGTTSNRWPPGAGGGEVGMGK